MLEGLLNRRRVLGVALAGALSAVALPATEPGAGTMPVEEIRAGMRGWGESVFAGSEPERFEAEVLGVLRDLAPNTDYVLARLSGHGLEETGVVAGMSGSPVWIDGRLVGAVAFAWPFAREAIAGITPIGAMRAIESSGAPPAAAAPTAVTLDDLVARRPPEELLESAAAGLARATGLDARGAVVWGASGFSQAGLERLGRALPRLAATGSGRVDRIDSDLAAGSSVAAVFVDGDLRLAATGTVTERAGEDLLAFGHPVVGLGEISLPMAAAEVVTVLSSRFSSFKLANSGPIVGEFVRDHPAGTLGRVGAVPRTVPLAVRVEAESGREFRMRLARIPRLIPLLAAIGALGAVDVAASAGGVEGLDLEIRADLGAHGELALEESFDGPNAVNQGALFLFAVLDFLLGTDLAQVEVGEIEVVARPWGTPRAATLVGAHAARSKLAPGETLELFVDLRAWRGGMERRRIELAIPADLPAGRYTLLIGDGASADSVRLALEPVSPVTLEQALRFLRSLGTSRELTVLGVLAGSGLTVSGEVLPRLPGSLRSIWAAGGGGGSRPLRLAIVQRERFAEPRPLRGLVRVDVELRRSQPVSPGDGGDEPERIEGGGPERGDGAPADSGGGARRASGSGKEDG